MLVHSSFLSARRDETPGMAMPARTERGTKK
jgi:hypothetical protein